MEKLIIGSTWILQERVESLKSRIERINERLASSNAPLVHLAFSKPTLRSVDTTIPGLAPFVMVTLSRQVASEHGQFRILARSNLNNTNDGFSMHSLYGNLDQVELEAVNNPQQSPNFCDHCETVRLRSKMYTIKVNENIMRVGTSCLDEFSGINLNRWVKGLEQADEEIEKFSQFSFECVKDYLVVEVDQVLLEAMRLIREEGYKTMKNNGRSTGIEAYICASANLAKNVESIESSPESIDKLEKVKRFILDSESDPSKRSDSYYNNLRNIISHGYVTRVESPILASALVTYENEMRKQAQHSTYSEIGNEHVGSIKDKINLRNITVDNVYVDEGRYGYITRLNLIDANNVFYKWNATGLIDVKAGDKINLSGTIDQHERWESKKYGKEILSNKLVRCKIMTDPEMDIHIEKQEKKKQKPKKERNAEPNP